MGKQDSWPVWQVTAGSQGPPATRRATECPGQALAPQFHCTVAISAAPWKKVREQYSSEQHYTK